MMLLIYFFLAAILFRCSSCACAPRGRVMIVFAAVWPCGGAPRSRWLGWVGSFKQVIRWFRGAAMPSDADFCVDLAPSCGLVPSPISLVASHTNVLTSYSVRRSAWPVGCTWIGWTICFGPAVSMTEILRYVLI